MSNPNPWSRKKIHAGWFFLIAGILVGIAGVLVELLVPPLLFDPRIITGLGILLAGVGIANLIRYTAALNDAQSVKRVNVEERDERSVLIRARAGNRAYWASTGLVFAGLMWASFAANDQLPELNGDTLWFFLAGAVIIPFFVYIISQIIDQKKM
jgi:ABC-type uncharacterized transport system permease subunit